MRVMSKDLGPENYCIIEFIAGELNLDIMKVDNINYLLLEKHLIEK